MISTLARDFKSLAHLSEDDKRILEERERNEQYLREIVKEYYEDEEI